MLGLLGGGSALRCAAAHKGRFSALPPRVLECPGDCRGSERQIGEGALPGAHLSSGAARCPLPVLDAPSRALPWAPEAECSSLREGSMLAKCLLSD